MHPRVRRTRVVRRSGARRPSSPATAGRAPRARLWSRHRGSGSTAPGTDGRQVWRAPQRPGPAPALRPGPGPSVAVPSPTGGSFRDTLDTAPQPTSWTGHPPAGNETPAPTRRARLVAALHEAPQPVRRPVSAATTGCASVPRPAPIMTTAASSRRSRGCPAALLVADVQDQVPAPAPGSWRPASRERGRGPSFGTIASASSRRTTTYPPPRRPAAVRSTWPWSRWRAPPSVP